MAFWIVNMAILFALNGFALSEDWTTSSETVMYSLAYVTEITQSNNLVTLQQRMSFSTCKFHCTERKCVAFFYIENNERCLCNLEEYASTEENVNSVESTGIIYGLKKTNVLTSYLQTSNRLNKRLHRQPGVFDCLSLYKLGYPEDGVYVIQLKEDVNIDVWCDMSNGGWTIIQRRQDGSVDFYRDWDQYVNGFGNTTGEYWLGLKYINILTTIGSELYIEMETFETDNVSPASAYAEYSTFKINDETDKFRLSVSGYNGSCADSLAFHNGWRFSTFDNDNDGKGSENCAVEYNGAWWYRTCHASNLNGLYLKGSNTEYGSGVVWATCWGFNYSLKRNVMKIRQKT
ncbi:microfibril-associated glycoprotein 4-like [Ruditapes philippinarum]|uniref:microfibril-associated glycoprotein 4-like n=1 Tax=Ruditapes philippinarum TaxID=129788 RepID=UPI00295B6D19|nr:microfibril-associated glycoprotein 4-like [Ruditapes philippinarum]